MMNNKFIAQLKLLYSIFAGILLVCVALFVVGVVSTEESPQAGGLSTVASPYAFSITDLRTDNTMHDMEQPIDLTGKSVKAHAHINRFDMDFYTRDRQVTGDPRITWVLVLQTFVVAAMAAIFVLVGITLVSLYRSAKRGHPFPARNASLLMVAGILLVVISLCVDTGAYLERTLARDLLQGTQWQPQASFTIHFTLIFFGLAVIFISQIFRIGHELQEEQELTV
ncbi:MAG: DUF2975 domain-containing protein [Bacteroidales bacterium]|nr:DUF2975 domain-containing protein [Bacteroidales bacterium]